MDPTRGKTHVYDGSTTGEYNKLILSYTAGNKYKKNFLHEKENLEKLGLSAKEHETENEKNLQNRTDIRRNFYKTLFNRDFELKNPGISRFSFVEHKTENEKYIQNRTDIRKNFDETVNNFVYKEQNEEKLLDNNEKQENFSTTNEMSKFSHNDGKQKNTINNNLDLSPVSEQTAPNEISKWYKKGMMIINCVSLILATITFTFCVLELLNNNLMIAIGGTTILQSSLITLIVFPLMLFIISVIEFFRKKDAKTYKKLFLLGVVICFTFFAIAMVTISIFINEVNTKMQQNMKNILINNYGKDPNHSVNKQWDELQQMYKCCGVDDNSTTIYQVTAWFEPYSHLECYKAKYVPPSCCTNPSDMKKLENCQVHCTGPPRYDHGDENPYLFTQGCYPKVKERLLRMAYLLIVLNILAVVLLVFKILCLFVYFIKIRN